MKLKIFKKTHLNKRIICLILSLLLMPIPIEIIPSSTAYAYDYLSRGIDVSAYQKDIDWDAVANDGIDFAIIRAGYGNTNAYPKQKDTYFDYNLTNAKRVGIKCGVYWFCYATSVEAAYEEADSCYNIIKGIDLDYPVYVDVEDEKSHVLINAFGKNKAKITEMTLAFCNRLASYGIKVGVYSNKDWFTNYIDKNQIINSGYEIWLAHYPSAEYVVTPDEYDKSSECGIWQYSSIGSVSGINGNVDVDVSYIDYAPYTDFWETDTSGQYTTKDVTTNLNIRSSPSTSASIVGKVPAGSTVNVTKTNGTWAYIEYNGTTGYCSLDYLQKAIQKPSTPVASLSKITTNSATITWNSVSGATSYKITFRKSGDEYQTIEENYTDTSYTKTGLSPNTQYYFRVYAVNVAGESDRSETVSAKTNQASFKVTFNANGGTTPTDSKSVTNGSKYGTLPDPEYKGHTFNGWFTEKSGGTKITADTVVNLSAEQTLYAHWTINTISFTYNTNGGMVMEGSPHYYADKDGYMFKVGNTDKITGKQNYNSSTDSSGLYNGTTFDLYRIGYSFIGWSTKKSGGTLIKEDEVVKFDKNIYPDIETKSGNVVFYAQWEPLENVGLYYYENITQRNYLLCSDLDKIDGVIKSDNADISTISIDNKATYNKEKILAINVLKSGDALQTKSSLSGCATLGSYPEDKTVYLSFYAKSGVPDTKVSVRFGYDDQYSEVKLSTTWKYYVLEIHKVPVSNAWLHWEFDKIGTCELSHIMLSDKKPVEGDFIASSETDAIKIDKTFKQGASYGKLYVPERKGYKFIGWFTDNSSESKKITTDTIAEANMGVFAHWKLIGDVNDDNEFNIADAVILQRWLLGKAELVDWQVADLCVDGKLDVFDMISIKQLLIGKDVYYDY